MRNLLIVTILGVLLCSSAPALAGGHDGWIDDYDKAVEIARSQGKDLLLDFTGSDWCIWCKRLVAEVFDKDEFKPAEEDFVLVMLDFPRDEELKKKVPNPKRNQELFDKYGVRGYPTILLVTAEGEVFGKTGYRQGGAEEYVKHLEELRTDGKADLAQAKKSIETFQKAEGSKKDAAYGEIIAAMAELEPDSPIAILLQDPVKSTFQYDPDNAKGLKQRATNALLIAGVYDEEIDVAAHELDPNNEAGLLERAVAAKCKSIRSPDQVKAACAEIVALDKLGPIKDPQIARDIYVSGALWSKQFVKDDDCAKILAEKAMQYVQDDERLVKMLNEIIEG